MGGGRVRWVALLAWALGSGCGPSLHVGADLGHGGPTLYVESSAVEHVAVRVNGHRVGTITRGPNCIEVPATGSPLVLDLVSVSGAARVVEPVPLPGGDHWMLELRAGGRLESDVLTLRRADRACAPR